MFPSCDPEPDGGMGNVSSVDIRFRALLNGQPLQMNERFTYNGKDMTISNLKFYLSDLVLVKGTLEAEVKEIDLIDFTSSNISAAGADNGITVTGASIPVDTYDGLKFGIGVPSDLNDELPTDFSSSHPLNNDSEYWVNWNSYIFHKIEGRYDNDSDPADLEESFVFHVGIDEQFRDKVFSNLEIMIEEGQTTEVVVDLEILDLMKEADGSAFDIPSIGNIHTSAGGDAGYPALIADNWVKAFSL